MTPRQSSQSAIAEFQLKQAQSLIDRLSATERLDCKQSAESAFEQLNKMVDGLNSKPEGGRRFSSPEAAFRWLKIPGMDIQEERAPEPLLNRCWCGKPISKGKNCCKECHDNELKTAAACLTTQEALDLFIDRTASNPMERAAVLADLQPFLKITDFVELVDWACDCGQTGAIHVRLKDQPDTAVVGMALEFHHNMDPECPIVGVESTGCSAEIAHDGAAHRVILHRVPVEQPAVESAGATIDPDWVMDTE